MSEERPAAIAAMFHDFRTVKTRGTIQLIFEVPQGKLKEIIDILGEPNPQTEQWVAIAPLRREAAENFKRNGAAVETDETRALKRAVLLCKEPRFWSFLMSVQGGPIDSEQDARDVLCLVLECQSRGEIAKDATVFKRFIALETDYRMSTGQMAAPR